MEASPVDDWTRRRTHHWNDITLDQLVERKRQQGLRVSVVVPARNEEPTIGDIVQRLRRDLMTDVPLVDELVIMDSDSRDSTGAVAAEAGATVHRTCDVRPDLGSFAGKGEAMWKSMFVTSGDLIVFVDADLTEWGTHFVSGLLGPLLLGDDVTLVKGFYDRTMRGAGPTDGGRVTELVARPLLAARWPDLCGVIQPLAGEWAIRRSQFEQLRVPVGYGVEIGALIDTYLARGLEAVAQVDLGRRGHVHQPLVDLGPMALELLTVADRRIGLAVPTGPTVTLRQFEGVGDDRAARDREVSVAERPPVASLRTAAVPEGVSGC